MARKCYEAYIVERVWVVESTGTPMMCVCHVCCMMCAKMLRVFI